MVNSEWFSTKVQVMCHPRKDFMENHLTPLPLIAIIYNDNEMNLSN